MERRVRASERDSSSPPSANRKTTVAPSLHCPIAAAPMTAIVMSTFMSSERACSDDPARAAHVIQPPATIASAYAATDAIGGTAGPARPSSQPAR